MIVRRDDIDGLRAIAVTAVVIFHAFPETKFGGFIGVDVFFVISGYLITGIIYRALLDGNFSFQDFYSRRIRRIFPALAIVLIGSMIIAWFTLSSFEARNFAKEVLAGAGFVSNFLYWSQANYFDVAAEQKPLLHLWSLAIEEQYYLIAPGLLWVSFRLRLNLVTLTVLCILASFATGILLTKTEPTAAFYMPWSRAWELYAGGLLALLTVRPPAALVKLEKPISTFLDRLIFSGQPVYAASHLRVAASVAGAACIIIGFIVIKPGRSFPGWPALLPVIGTVCLIFAGPQTWLNRKILSHPAMVGIGLISYPLYLWHWPLLSFTHIDSEDPVSTTTRATLVALSVVFAAATYFLAERPLRFRISQWKAVTSLITTMIFVAGTAGLYFFSANSNQKNADAIGLEKISELRNLENQYGPAPCFKFTQEETYQIFIERKCLVRKWPEARTVLLIGDSHSASLSHGLRPYFESRHINLLQISTGFCEPTSRNEADKTCVDINELGERTVREIHPDLVIINSHWIAASSPSYFPGGGEFTEHLKIKLQRLRNLGAKNIVIVGQIPTWTPSLPAYLMKKYVDRELPIPERAAPDAQSLIMDDLMGSITYPSGVKYISLKNILCEKGKCLVRVGPDATDLIIWDYGHLTPKGARYVVQEISERNPDLMLTQE